MTKDEQERALAGLYDKREKLASHLEEVDKEIERVRSIVLEEVPESVEAGAQVAEGTGEGGLS